jgi:hypothetical protein
MLIDKLVKEAWGEGDRGLLTRSLFTKTVQDARRFFSKRIEGLSQTDLIYLLTDYLRINGYAAERFDTTKEMPFVTSSFVTADNVAAIGYGAAAPLWTDAHLEYLEKHFPTADYYHVFAVKSLPKKTRRKVKIVTVDSVIIVLMYVFIFEYFFEEYLHSILAMPGFRDHMYDYIEKEIGLTAEQIETLSAGFEKQKLLPKQ